MISIFNTASNIDEFLQNFNLQEDVFSLTEMEWSAYYNKCQRLKRLIHGFIKNKNSSQMDEKLFFVLMQMAWKIFEKLQRSSSNEVFEYLNLAEEVAHNDLLLQGYIAYMTSKVSSEIELLTQGLIYSKQAIQAFQAVDSVSEVLAHAHIQSGIVYLKLNQYLEAEEAFTEAIKISQRINENHRNTASTACFINDIEASLEARR